MSWVSGLYSLLALLSHGERNAFRTAERRLSLM
uniref:Uncharacterized protein n=1 Tax=Anguilla anguilla TaxID=7936 RepID=A0A0E9Q1R2_ANGAN